VKIEFSDEVCAKLKELLVENETIELAVKNVLEEWIQNAEEMIQLQKERPDLFEYPKKKY